MIISPKTDTNLRSENQDVFGHYDTPYGSLMLVCDGMGGAKAGHAAADYTTTRFPQLLREAHARAVPVVEALHEAVAEVNRKIYELGSGEDPAYRGMGTTLVFALKSQEGFLIGHVGDSRAYLLREGKLEALTQDHAPVAELLARGIISAEQARNHPRRSVLSRAIGPQPETELELREEAVPFLRGDSLILCSDGLSGFVTNKDIEVTLGNLEDQRKAAEVLVNLAKDKGSDDNITVLVAHEPKRPSDLFTDTNLYDSGAPAVTRATPGAAVTKKRPSTLSARIPSKGESLIDEMTEPTMRNTALVLVLLFMLGCLITWQHYHAYYAITPYDDQAEMVDEEQEEITEVETLADYDLERTDCPLTLADSARAMLNDFEKELRRSSSLTTEEEIEIGKEYVIEFNSRYYQRVDTDRGWKRYLDRVGNILAARSKRKQITYSFHYVDDPTENAVALPGGNIYVFRGLLERHIENEAQLAFVLAHEISHVERRHTLAFERIIRRIPQEVRNTAGGAVSFFINQPFSSKREEEADFAGLKLMMSAGYSPIQAVMFMQSMKKDEELNVHHTEEEWWRTVAKEASEFFRSHPSYERRECQVRNEVIHLLRSSEGKPLYVGRTNFEERISKAQIMF